jgi:hypothetical protein
MSQYLWRIPDEYPSKLIGEYDRSSSPDRFLFLQGAALGQINGIPAFRFKSSRADLLPFDVLPNNATVPLISVRAASLLRKLCPADFQLLSAKVTTDDADLDGYAILNAVVKISAMDHAQSGFNFIPGTKQIMKVNRLRSRSGAMGVHHLARESDYPPYLWASDEVKAIFEDANIKGCAFLVPEAIRQ